MPTCLTRALTLLGCLTALGLASCGMDPGTGKPATGPQGQPQAELSPLLLEALPLPAALPFDAWTRTAPITLVNERGEGVLVVPGHHMRLKVLRRLPVRALVACAGCRSPVEGWIQNEMLMPAGHTGRAGEWDDSRLSLALYAEKMRQSLLTGSRPGGLDEPGITDTELIALLDHGLRADLTKAFSPPWAREPGFQGWTLILTLESGAWTFGSLESRNTPLPE